MTAPNLMPRSNRRILDAGSGLNDLRSRPSWLAPDEWEVVTVDIDARAEPDHVGSIIDMKKIFPDASFHAIWSSHSVEHLFIFELRAALKEFERVLKTDGFVLLTCPDLESVAKGIVDFGLDHVAYVAPAGPITLHDILYGHTPSIEGGATAMAHRTGLTEARLGSLAMEAGFVQAIVGRGPHYDLWALLCKAETDVHAVSKLVMRSGAGFLFDGHIGYK